MSAPAIARRAGAPDNVSSLYFSVPAYVPSNVNDDHARPGRLDYSVLLTAPATVGDVVSAPAFGERARTRVQGTTTTAVAGWRPRVAGGGSTPAAQLVQRRAASLSTAAAVAAMRRAGLVQTALAAAAQRRAGGVST